jgi:hypothetical protein
MPRVLPAEPDGSMPTCEKAPSEKLGVSHFPAISEKLEDPNYSANKVLLLISAGIALFYLGIAVLQRNPQFGYILSNIGAQPQALRGLADSVHRREEVRERIGWILRNQISVCSRGTSKVL